MTARDRVDAVIDYGFTERQARFLVLVMRHAGLCVRRQYAAPTEGWREPTLFAIGASRSSPSAFA